MDRAMMENRRSLDLSSEASYCDVEIWNDWGSRSTIHDDPPSDLTPQEDLKTLKAERDFLIRSLSNERKRAENERRANDARFAELHGVIAELIKSNQAKSVAILEERESDECESTTQQACDLENDCDLSKTDQNEDTSSMFSEQNISLQQISKEEIYEEPNIVENNESDYDVYERYDIYANTVGCCQAVRECSASDGLLSRDPDSHLPLCHAKYNEPKVASKVRLRRTTDENTLSNEVQSLERLSLNVLTCEGASCPHSQQFETAKEVAKEALTRALIHEEWCRSVCKALTSADRCMEVYDVLLALKETEGTQNEDRMNVESIAHRLLRRLQKKEEIDSVVSPGPWLDHDKLANPSDPIEWCESHENLLRSYAAKLKRESVMYRPKKGFTEIEECDVETPTDVTENQDGCHQENCYSNCKKNWETVNVSETDL